jgi:hypothetical protein
MKRIAKASHDVRDIEKCIVKLYEKGANDDKISDEIESLLMERWGLMHKSIVWDDEFIAKLVAMNEKMKQALIDMRNLAFGTYNHQIANCPDDKEFDVTGRLFVDDMEMEGWEYGSHMSDYLSEILQTPEYSSLYRYGVAHEVIFESSDRPYGINENNTEMNMLYMAELPENWNEHMDREKTANLNIIYGVHNMIDHCHWTLQDLINVKSYKSKIEVEYRNKRER